MANKVRASLLAVSKMNRKGGLRRTHDYAVNTKISNRN